MTHPIASLTLDGARSCVMQSAFLTQRTVSSKPIVFSWSDNIRHEGFLSPILLLAVITVAVAMVVLIVVDAIIGVVVVVSGVPSIIKLSFVIIDSMHRIVLCYLIHQPLSYGNGFLQSLRLRGGWAYALHQDKASSVRFPFLATGVLVGPVFLLGLLAFAIVEAYASRAATTLSATSFLMAA
ncbi:hypothetical protein Tco_0860424 [Tanacetum coccineum]|uniref:Uncharacterized protein n=1 Tax=Tanacetum coccineum TaxID=301880 RepID=A0ABQ5BH58_9ASTR